MLDANRHSPAGRRRAARRGAPWLALAAALGLGLLASVARAEIYSFVDDDGVIHFTNIPPGQKTALRPVPGTANAFDWTDELGAMRKLHRVEVSTYDAMIVEAGRYYVLPPALIKAVIAAESAFDPRAVSKAGALGLMQLMPQTAQEMRVGDVFDPRTNIFGGARYLRIMANRFAGDVRRTAAAYNAGPLAVERSGDIPAIEETRTYVQRVLKLYRHYLQNWADGVLPAATQASPR